MSAVPASTDAPVHAAALAYTAARGWHLIPAPPEWLCAHWDTEPDTDPIPATPVAVDTTPPDPARLLRVVA
jgi:hypothetical protein